MPYFIVHRQDVYTTRLLVEAASESEALTKASEEGWPMLSEPEYDHTIGFDGLERLEED